MKPLLLVRGGLYSAGPHDNEIDVSLMKKSDDQTQSGTSEITDPALFKPLSPNTPLELTPQLRALLRSQIQTSPPGLTRPNPRRLQPDIPTLNSWLRPMPQNRIKNMRQKHYALLLERTLPPLPTDEWYRLRDLASGKARVESVIPRRKSSSTINANHDRHELRDGALETVMQYSKVPKNVFGNRDAHTITPRFMRRLYAQVFSQCPLMEWDAGREQWKVIWGERALYDELSQGSAPSDELSGRDSEAMMDDLNKARASAQLPSS